MDFFLRFEFCSVSCFICAKSSGIHEKIMELCAQQWRAEGAPMVPWYLLDSKGHQVVYPVLDLCRFSGTNSRNLWKNSPFVFSVGILVMPKLRAPLAPNGSPGGTQSSDPMYSLCNYAEFHEFKL